MQAQAPSRREVRSRKLNAYFLPGLRRVRLNRQMSIRQLAEKSGLSPDTIWRVESGQRGAEPLTRRKLTKALGTKVDELLTPGDEEVNTES